MNRARRVVTVVSALGAAQSVAIVTQVGVTGDAVGGTIFAAGPTAALVLSLLTSVFLAVAITVTSVVVASAAEAVLTGEVQRIALRRLVGASAADERRRMSREILRRAGVGMAVGAVVGYGLSVVALATGLGRSDQLSVGAAAYVPSPLLLIAFAAQFAVTRGAVRRGTRGVLAVQPVAALRTAGDADGTVPATLAVPPRASVATAVAGAAILAFAVVASRTTPLAMLLAVAGGIVSFVGIVSCAARFVPPLLRAIAGVLPDRLPVVIARRSLLAHPERTSRAVLAVAATITLVTTFAVGIATFDHAVQQHYQQSAMQGLADDVLDAVVSVVAVLTAFLAVTAGVALGNAVSFGAWVRRRNTALLRVLGQESRGTRATIVVQSLLLVLTATVVGVVLGVLYGWVGAQSVFGVEAPGGVVAPVLPWPVLVATVVAAGVLTVVASVLPVRAALRLAPIRAYLAA